MLNEIGVAQSSHNLATSNEQDDYCLTDTNRFPNNPMHPQQNKSQSNTNNANQSQPSKSQLSGVRRYKKGRSFADTLFGKMRYGKDLVTEEWVAIKENRKWFAQN
eukprot:264541_1